MSSMAHADGYWFLYGTVGALVVEDDEAVRDVYVTAFRHCPLLHVRSAATADEALAILRAEPARTHFCLLDLGVPGPEDGYRVLLEYARRLPVVVVTGRTSESEGARCIEMSAVHVLQKPITDTWALTRLACEQAFGHRLLALAGGDAYLQRTVHAMVRRDPDRVGQWAVQARAEESYFRKRWRRQGVAAKLVLALNKGYRHAISVFSGVLPATEAEAAQRKRVLDYLSCRVALVRKVLGPPLCG